MASTFYEKEICRGEIDRQRISPIFDMRDFGDFDLMIHAPFCAPDRYRELSFCYWPLSA